MSDRVRVVVILAVVALLGGGGGYYFFKIYRPAQDLKNAQEEIAGWETRFAGARDCLLGKSPGSSKTSEALAIREMAPDPWDRGRCTPLISKLNRGEAPDTGIPAIEAAWAELDKAAQKAAIAFARHVSESTTLENDPLPGALDALDEARNKLRTTARMAATETSGKPLAVAETLPITDGGKKLTSLTVNAIPSAHGLILFGRSETGMVQVVLSPGADPKAARVDGATVRAVPDMSWGASIATSPQGTEVMIGGLDPQATISVHGSFPMERPTIAAVAGTPGDGVVVFGNETELVVARSKDGKVTASPAMKIAVAEAAIDVDGRVGIVWGTQDKTQGQILTPGAADEPVVELPALGTLCMTKDRVWGQNGETAVSFGGGRPVFQKDLGPPVRNEPVPMLGPRPPRTYPHLQGCTPDAALFHDRLNVGALAICTDDCRTAQLPSGAPEYATTTVVGGKLVAIASHGGVLGVWREGAQPVFYALPETARPVLAHEWPAMALTDGKVIDVIARGETSFLVIRIPAA